MKSIHIPIQRLGMNVKKLVSILSKLINCPACSAVYCTLHLAHIICKCDTLHLFHFLFSPVFREIIIFSTFCTTYWSRIPLHSADMYYTKSKLLCTNAFAFALNALSTDVWIYFADLLVYTRFTKIQKLLSTTNTVIEWYEWICKYIQTHK